MQRAYREIEPDDAAFLTEHVFADLGRPGDGGIVAAYDREPAGACWYRLFPGGGRMGDVEAVPQLTIAVLPQFRAQGVGGTLLGPDGPQTMRKPLRPQNAVARASG